MDIYIVGEMIKLSSYYTGRWVGQYSLDIVNNGIHVNDMFLCDAIDDWSCGYSIPLL